MNYNTHLPLRTILAVVFVSFVVFAIPLFVFGTHGGGHTPADTGSFTNPLGDITLVAFLEEVLDALVIIAFPILVLFLVYAGFLFVSARGNENKINDAKRIFLWTFVGALLVLGAWMLSQAIKGTVDEIRGFGARDVSSENV